MLLGAVFTGPLFGWFGQQWRTRRAIAGALVTAAALCLEPLARRASVDPIRFRAVWLAEVAAGLALAAAVLLRRSSSGAALSSPLRGNTSPVWPEGSNSERVRRLQSVTDAALAHLRLDELLAALLDRTREILEVDTCAILLLDEETNELVARAALGIEEEVEQGVRVPVGGGFAGRIAAEKRPVILDDVDHAHVLNPILREKGIKSMLGVPLVVEGDVRGVLHVGSLTPRDFRRTRSSCSSSWPTGRRSRSSMRASSRPSAPRASGSSTSRR